MTIATLFGLRHPGVYTTNKAVPLKCADPSLLYGVELEIEHVPNWDELEVAGMSSVEDGSLRNNGREFITQPSTYSVLMYMLERFFTKAKLTDDNYSERCSVHVHANCQDMELDQVAGVCLLYQVFERLLYAFVGNDRDRNIFCIPWDQTTITYQVINSIDPRGLGPRNWQKYTGLNIIPLGDKGTLEFRQMGGTYDLEKIGNWLNLIGSMYAYAKKTSLDKIKEEFVNLNTTSAYSHMTENVFTDWAHILMSIPGYKMSLEEGVLNMKYSLMNPVKVSNTKKEPVRPARMDEVEVRVDEADPHAGLTLDLPTWFTADARRTITGAPPPPRRVEVRMRNPSQPEAQRQGEVAGNTTARTFNIPAAAAIPPNDPWWTTLEEIQQREAAARRLEDVQRQLSDLAAISPLNSTDERGL